MRKQERATDTYFKCVYVKDLAMCFQGMTIGLKGISKLLGYLDTDIRVYFFHINMKEKKTSMLVPLGRKQ